MSQKRNKIHKPGERLSVYLNKELPDHFFEWIAKQDDVSAFVIYALEQLYNETGNKNIANMLPRRFYFEDVKNSLPVLTSNPRFSTASEQTSSTGSEQPSSTESVQPSSTSSEQTLSTESVQTPSTESDNQQSELVQESEFNNEELKESEEQPPETGQWENLGDYNPDEF